MINKYTIPIYNISGGNNKQTIKTAIDQLDGKYLADFEAMEDADRIKLLECINDLTHIYFTMKKAEVKK